MPIALKLGRAGERRVAFAIILIAVLIRVPLLGTPLTYLNDSWREADTASIARLFARNGFHILYPQIYWGGTGPGYVETEFQLYPFLVSLLYAAFGEHLWFGRLVSLLFMAGALALFRLLARRLLPPGAALWALGFFAVCPLVTRYSVAFMPEAALLCFYVGALYWLVSWVETQKGSDLWLGSACIALGALLKPTALLAGVIVLPLLIQRRGWAALVRPRAWIALAICLLPPLAWYLHAHAIFLRSGNSFGIAAGGDTKWGDPSYWLTRSFYESTFLLNAKWVFAQAGVIPFLVGVWLALKRRDDLFLAVGFFAIVAYYLLIARAVEKQYSVHYYVQAVPIAAVGVGAGIHGLLRLARRRAAAVAVAVAVAVPILFFSGALYADRIGEQGNIAARGELECARIVERVAAPGERVIVESISRSSEHGRPKNYQDPKILFHSDRYGWILPRDGATPERVQELQRQGARYFVLLHERLDENHPLAAYLKSRAVEVGETVRTPWTWDIFRLAPPDSTGPGRIAAP